MVVNRPLLYLSLPSVAVVLGLFWLHHRKAVKCKEAKKKESEIGIENGTISGGNTKPSNSISINVNIPESNETFDGTLGKSAPINIIQHGRHPTYPTDSQIDSEILKLKIFQCEARSLRSISEDFESMSSPTDLAGTVQVNKGNVIDVQKDEKNSSDTFIIKATSNAKISPEDSFLENKYTEKDENISFNSGATETENDKILSKEFNSDASPSFGVNSPDSGKGSSLSHLSGPKKYEFIIPMSLIPKFCGRKGAFLEQLKSKCKINIYLKKHIANPKAKICVLEGAESEINAAVPLIRARLPKDRFPNFTVDKLDRAVLEVPLFPSFTTKQLSLIEGVNNDVNVSAVLSGHHIFLQHPLHPSHASLKILQHQLNNYYEMEEAPMLPELIESAICVGKVDDNWCRIQIVERTQKNSCVVKLLDYGGYYIFRLAELRQIRPEYMLIPFQATECLLSNLESAGEPCIEEISSILKLLTSGVILQAQVVGYNSDNLPEVNLYSVIAPNYVIFINKELVARNLAKWIDCSD